MFAYIESLILGIIEGITEFLPISSTGHLLLTERALGFHDSKDLFAVVIQLGAIAAVVWYFRRDLWSRVTGLLRHEREAIAFWKILIVATIPAGLIGLILDKHMEQITTPGVIAAALIVGGIILWVVDRKPLPKNHHQDPVDFSQISLKRAVLVGLGQCVAIVPGVSRSGATIVSALLSGINRPTATAFSFYLSIPVIVAASGYKLAKYGDSVHTIPGGIGSLAIGLVFAFITALMAVAWLLKYIAGHNFRPFAYYRIGLGVIILILLATNVL